MADAGDGAQAQHHFLVHIEHGDEQCERPEQGGAVVLAGLGVGAEGAGVVIADHDDEAWAEDREQRFQARRPALARAGVVPADGAERAPDISQVSAVEHGLVLVV